MQNISLNKLKKVHFIGIGGISMSALAEILIEKGISVSGSDSKESELTIRLAESGAKILYGQSAENITSDIDLVVYTAAVHSDNPELMAAEAQNIPVMVRADFLGLIMKEYKNAINIAGTHGKTTTTSMVSHILLKGECDPTILVGGMLPSIGGNLRIGHSENFVTESCEYTNSFLSFFPTTAVILNVREDHLDFFKDINDIRNSFKKFVKLVPDNGYVIINSDIDEVEYFTSDLTCNVITFGSDLSKSDYSAENIGFNDLGCCHYTLLKNGKKITDIELSVPGIHNVYNSLAAIAVGFNMNLSVDVIKSGLLSYNGTDRRFQYKGETSGVTIIDDYAHHPDEISATLKTAKNYPHKDIWVVFQPHTYSRTKALFDRFAQALSAADHVVLADIYAARETDNLGVSSELLAEEIKKYGTDVHYLPDFKSIEEFLRTHCLHGDLLITMGAGNVVNIGEELLK